MKDLEDEADRLLEKLQPIKRLQDNLRRNISQIKELINQARKQANSVSMYNTLLWNYLSTISLMVLKEGLSAFHSFTVIYNVAVGV